VSADPSPDGPPIFVVGCQRSGTTLVRMLLDSHPRISCGPETRYLESLRRVVDEDWNRLERYGFSQQEWLERIATLFGGVHADYAARRGKARWADKSPRYALQLDFVLRVFPDAQVVHVLRDARDVVVSHRKRFGYLSSLKAAVKWPRYVRAARAAQERLPQNQFHEVRYEDLVTDQEATVRRLTTFLGEEFDPSMLEIDEHEHDVPERYHLQAGDRRRQQGTDSPIHSVRAGAHRRELDPLARALVWCTSRRLLREVGYR
jgi:hypothetical protein